MFCCTKLQQNDIFDSPQSDFLSDKLFFAQNYLSLHSVSTSYIGRKVSWAVYAVR